jgi:hypothetical protein
MAIDFNHTIVSARDSKASAEFLAEMLGLPAEVGAVSDGHHRERRQHRLHEYRRRDHGAALRLPGQRTGI